MVLAGVVLAATVLGQTIQAPTISNNKGEVTDILQPTSYQIGDPNPQSLHAYLADEITKYGNPKDYYTLYNLIQCESSWNIDAHNPKSSASGLAQFLDSTWNGYCGGDKDDAYSQIHCLVIAWSGGHQNWWSESRDCWSRYITH